MNIQNGQNIYLQLQPWKPLVKQPTCIESLSKIPEHCEPIKPHPCLPLDYDSTYYPRQPITNKRFNTCFMPNGMSTEPIFFANLVTGTERNPEHAARAALSLRYTLEDWKRNADSLYKESDLNRECSEDIRNQSIKLMRETDNKCVENQMESTKHLGERVKVVQIGRQELNEELEKLVAETEAFAKIKKFIVKAIQDIEIPLHICQECLYQRESRQGLEKVHDITEKALLKEIDNILKQRKNLDGLFDRVSAQLKNCQAAQYELEQDVKNKEVAIIIDAMCHELSHSSPGVTYYTGIEKLDHYITLAENYSEASKKRIIRSQEERNKIIVIRTEIEEIIENVSQSIWNKWNETNDAIEKRINEMEKSTAEALEHFKNIQKEVFGLDKYIIILKKAIEDKTHYLKVAQTRLEARSHRKGIELCRDEAQARLVEEVKYIQDSVLKLHKKLQETEAQKLELLKTKKYLEESHELKVNALYIDKDKLMGIRKAYPVTSFIKF